MADGEMRYGAVLPGRSAPEQLEQAVLAERAGWDGVFVSEAAYGVDAGNPLGHAGQHVRAGSGHDRPAGRRPSEPTEAAGPPEALAQQRLPHEGAKR
jgi:hypothetical protein